MARRLTLAVLFVTAGFTAGLVLTGMMRSSTESAAQATRDPGPVRGAAPAPARPAAALPAAVPDLTMAADRALQSVTNISSTQVVRTPNSPFGNDPFFNQFFGGGDNPFGYRDRLEQSLGSGVVVSSDGYVLTNNHVVFGGRGEVLVTLADKRELPAKVVGADEGTDLAVLKVDATNLPAMPWGDSSSLKIAEWVLAIGNPFGVLSQTVTLGIVSATGRRIEGASAAYADFVQTDAAINRGNSGGALVNARGELVGINSAIFSETGGYQGIGFAVPSNLAKQIMTELITHGTIRRGTIAGIELYPMSARLAREFNAPDTKGVIVSNISQTSAAYQGGLRRYDIIVTFNGTEITDAQALMRLIGEAPLDQVATLGVLREGRAATARVPIVQAQASRRTRAAR